jgi:cyclin-dependent kinase 8/11
VFDFAEYDLHDIVCTHASSGVAGGPPGGPPPPFLVRSVLWQLLRGVAYLHDRHVMHRDLKPSNILIMGPDNAREPGCVKIADFGLARSVRAPLRPLSENGVVVTIWYRAPELLLGAKHYTRGVDVWAVGAIFGECLSGRALFKGAEVRGGGGNPFQLDQLRKIFNALGTPTVAQWPALAHMPYWCAVTWHDVAQKGAKTCIFVGC